MNLKIMTLVFILVEELVECSFCYYFNSNAGDSYRAGLFLGYSFYPKSNRLYVKLDQGCKGLAGNMDLLFIRGEKLRTYLDDVPEEFKFNQESVLLEIL